uniref:glycosyl hydrolase family 95 catalytic domain-containing protein n=1 Tax=uncultured Draconibacterium sp. TaxID=1573823 RepID=UPI0032179F89
MRNNCKLISLLLFLMLAFFAGAQEDKEYIGFNVDYKNYLSKHDVVFQTLNYEGFEGLTIGNGDIGGMVWCTKSGIEIQINKSDLFDKPNTESKTTLRAAGRLKIDFGIPNTEWLYLNDFEARMSMYDATSRIKSATPFSNTNIETWVDANANAWIIDCDLKTMGELLSGTSMSVELERWGSRSFGGWYGGYNKDASAGIGNSKANTQNGDIYFTEHFDGLDFVVACRVLGVNSSPKIKNNKRAVIETDAANTINAKIIVSVVTSNESDNLLEDAINILDNKEKETIEKAKIAHDAWWKGFWERSFVSISDDYIENIYYYRRYVTASASRASFPIVFNGSLWTWNHDIRQWVTPHHWNTQQQYWGVAVQNDCDLMLPYINTYFRLMPYAEAYAKERGVENAILWSEAHDFLGNMVYKYRNDMINNFTPASQIAAVFWEYYQFTGDKEFLQEKCYPFIKKAAQFYMGHLKWDEEKQEYYSFPTQPYEHAQNNQLKNSSSDRYMIEALLNWCIESAKTLKVDQLKIDEWTNVVEHLWEPPVIEVAGTGKVFGTAFTNDDKPYPAPENYRAWGMYHFDAHTTQVFPANLMGLDEKDTEYFKIAENVSRHQPAAKNAITPGSIVSARLGMGNLALEKMTNSIRRMQHFPQGLFYNLDHWYQLSKYADSIATADVTCQRDYIYDKRSHYSKKSAGSSGLPAAPFVQCGMEALSIVSTTVSEMLLQSHEGKIRVFPAVPDNWEGAFVLRGRGAFMISSEIDKNKNVSFVGIESLSGNECKLQNPWSSSVIKILNTDTGKKVKYKLSKDGVISFNTKPNGKYIITASHEKVPTEKVFTGEQNNGPKYFKEATLGSKKDF